MKQFLQHLRLYIFFANTLLTCACLGPELNVLQGDQAQIELERQIQRENSLIESAKLKERLYKLSYPLRRAAVGVASCQSQQDYGFTVHNAHLYASILGKQWQDTAQRVYHFNGRLLINLVHPLGPAARAGLTKGDCILAINGEPIDTLDEQSQIETFARAQTKQQPLKLKLMRAGLSFEVEIRGEILAAYPVQLIHEDMINAFADGRSVMVTEGMMQFANSDNELALVIGHELAHNCLLHIRKTMNNYVLGSIFDIAIAVASGINTQGAFGNSAAQKFSQDFEKEADYAGLYIMARAGFEIQNAANFWRRMASKSSRSIESDFGASHPSTPERFVAIEKTVEEINSKLEKNMALLPNFKK